MVFHITSINVKLLRNISEDFKQCQNCTAYEYMKTYIEQCPDCVEEEKLKWIASTFLGTEKHGNFLRDLGFAVAKDLSAQENDYLVTILYAVIFQIPPEEKENLYKSIFNLSKDLLHRFSSFFSNNEILPFISQIACTYYDAKFVTEKIISPLFLWQPYISEISHDFDTYILKKNIRRSKSPTVPLHLTVLTRPPREMKETPSALCTSANFKLPKRSKLLTKKEIDQRLNIISIQNKQRADQLLNEVRKQNFSFAKLKSDKYYQKITEIKDEIKKSTQPLKFKSNKLPLKLPSPVKYNVTSIKRMSKTMAKSEKEEIQWMQDILKTCRNTAKIRELKEKDRNEREWERKINIEKNRLIGQLSYEQAILAKQNVTDENKRKREEFVKEKNKWFEEIEQWKQNETEKNKNLVEKLSLMELELLESKINLTAVKRNAARNVKKKSQYLLSRALKEKNNELQRRVNMIKDIKVLALVAKQAKVPRLVDLTESSGLGLLCEMSIAELQEQLFVMKTQIKEELEMKKQNIQSNRDSSKQEIEEAKNTIKHYLEDKSVVRNENSKKNAEIAGFGDIAVKNNKEITYLKKTLEEKRQKRQRITAIKNMK